jgi:hypothetical protein
MALPGMKSTGDFNTDERPRSWREGILRLSPRNGAPLYALTSMMKSEKTDDPEYYWWEEPLFMYTFTIAGALIASDTTVNVVSGATRLKPGDMLKVTSTEEHIRVLAVNSDTQFTVERARGAGGSTAGTAAGIADTTVLLYIGSAYREGAPKSVGTSTAPVKQTNLTQIFRDPVEITRTAMQTTTYRTGDPFANDKQRTAHKHALGIERALLFGSKYETLESGQPIRWTGGITSFIPTANKYTVTGGVMDMDELEAIFPAIFAFGSSEKLVFGSLTVMSLMTTLVRKNGQYQWGGTGEKEYGMSVKRFFTPAGTLTFMEHPMLSATPYMKNDMLILDTANLKYRYLQDTTYLKNRQDNSTDGKTDEFLTECGLEVHHGSTHFWVKGLNSVAKDA